MSDQDIAPVYDGVKIIADEKGFIAVHKPPGIGFQRVDTSPGILEIIRQMPEYSDESDSARLYPVHRLDKVTSGILIFAKGRKSANEISNHFRFKRVKKIYLALSDRKPKKKQGLISGDMEKGRRSGYILLRSKNNPALTRFKSFTLNKARPGLRLFVLMPLTGKTHQIRVAMKSLGAPILGDPLYGRFELARNEERTWLHAYAIEFQSADKNYRIIDPPGPGLEFTKAAFKKDLGALGDPFLLF